ncbi:hypothetical protein LLH23_10210 [bacterium]|nr:hypothetical protein [bacterium]
MNNARLALILLAVLVAAGLVTAAPLTCDEVEKLLTSAPVKGTPEPLYGGMMTKYKLRLEDGTPKGFKCAFKPHQYSSQSYAYEIAAYEIDRLCGMGHVPVTVKRRLPLSVLRQAGGPLGRVIVHDDLVSGSLQQWVNEARDPVGSGARGWALTWLARLDDVETSLPDLDKACQVCDMLILDYLQTNMDRFSGGNILADRTGRLWFIDNAEGFGSSSQPAQDFERLRRFSRRTIEALRRSTEADFTQQVGPWVSGDELRGLLQRRKHVLERVDASLAKYGEKRVYLEGR